MRKQQQLSIDQIKVNIITSEVCRHRHGWLWYLGITTLGFIDREVPHLCFTFKKNSLFPVKQSLSTKTSSSILYFISELNNLSNYGAINYKNMNTCCHSLFPVHLLHAKMINSLSPQQIIRLKAAGSSLRQAWLSFFSWQLSVLCSFTALKDKKYVRSYARAVDRHLGDYSDVIATFPCVISHFTKWAPRHQAHPKSHILYRKIPCRFYSRLIILI